MSIDKNKLGPKGLGTLFIQTENDSNVVYSLACVYLYEAEGLEIKERGTANSGDENIAEFTYEYTQGDPKDDAKIKPYIVGPYMPILSGDNGTGEPQIASYISIENLDDPLRRKKGKVNTSKPILLPVIPGDKGEEKEENFALYYGRSIVIEKAFGDLDLLDGEADLVDQSGFFIFVLAKTNNIVDKWMTNSKDNISTITCYPNTKNQSEKVVNAVSIVSVDEINQYTSIVIEGVSSSISYDKLEFFEVL